MFKRVLIANRGEIAIRIARAAAALGIDSVSIHAPADSLALHSRSTTVSLPIASQGHPGDPVAAYLDIDVVIAAAKASGCDCVHPGYGFLSENAGFAQRCRDEGLSFIGPDPQTLALFGDKTRARGLAVSLGVPVIRGSAGVVPTAGSATAAAEALGYPVMVKAVAGGGGRGMRRVDRADDMVEAFARCQGEALAAFGEGDLFLEKLMVRPRHIEVQILGDRAGAVVHVHERDCSVQLRNQKVVEIAPAPGLDPALRERILSDALKLARAAGQVNAGTLEFLVNAETGEHVFIEGNPRIQVEHTVTEQVTGLDLVEIQFRIAAGASLAELGLADQAAVPPPRGFAVQARVVAHGGGLFTAYHEPTGPGVRVDSCAYVGWAPPPQFDPMFAKVIGRSNSTGSYVSALDRTMRALDDFHIAGVATNLRQLRAILAHPSVRTGGARTTLLAEEPELGATVGKAPTTSATVALLDQRATALSRGFGVIADQASAAEAGGVSVALDVGEVGVESPMAGTVLDVVAQEGAAVSPGDTLMIISAMKMETAITAPRGGVVARLSAVDIGDQVSAGQVLAAIAPTGLEAAEVGPRRHGDDSWAPVLAEVAALQAIAHGRFAEGSRDPGVVRQRNRGKLTCRERIDLLLDAGTFREVGSLAGFTSYDDEGRVADFTPANHIGGWGKVDGRTAVVCADDFTSRGGHADGAIGAKSGYLDRLSLELLCPSIRLLDGSSVD